MTLTQQLLILVGFILLFFMAAPYLARGAVYIARWLIGAA